jgi:hypothetical protein
MFGFKSKQKGTNKEESRTMVESVRLPNNPAALIQEQEEDEMLDPKVATYAALGQINEGFSNVFSGLKALKAAGIILPALSEEQIDWRIKEARGFLAILNHSITNALSEIEESDVSRYRAEAAQKQ